MVKPIQDSQLQEAEAVMRRRGFGDVANLLQLRIAEKEKAGYIARIAELEQKIARDEELGQKMLSKLHDVQAANRELDNRIVELQAKTATRVWLVLDENEEPVAAYVSKDDAARRAEQSSTDVVGARDLSDLCLTFNNLSYKWRQAEREIQVLSASVSKQQAAVSKLQSALEHYETQGLLSRIFRR